MISAAHSSSEYAVVPSSESNVSESEHETTYALNEFSVVFKLKEVVFGQIQYESWKVFVYHIDVELSV